MRILWYNTFMVKKEEYDALILENIELKKHIKLLTEAIQIMRQNQFGRSSEKSVVSDDGQLLQLNLFNEAEIENASQIPEPEFEQITYKRKKKKGKRELDFAGLPVEQIIHELPDSERICPKCGKPMKVCGHDVLRRELTVIPAQYKNRTPLAIRFAHRRLSEP